MCDKSHNTVKDVQYYNIDLFKFIFAIVVVMIHTRPFENISEDVSWYFSNTFCNLAVPFFFTTSGFLFFGRLGSDEGQEKQKVKKYIGHILKMYIVWCVIWFPWKLLAMMPQGGITLQNILYYIRDVVLVSGGDALWYLLALAVSVILVNLSYKKIQEPRVIVAIAAVFYAVRVIIGSWYGLFDDHLVIDLYYSIFKGTDNALLCGFIFVAIGMAIAEQENKPKIKQNLIAFLAFLVIVIVEAYIIKTAGFNRNGVCHLISLPFATYFLFRLILSLDVKGNADRYKYLRVCSTLIYLSHCIIIRNVKMVFSIIDINVSGIILFILALIISLAFAIIVRYFAEERKLKIFKLLY